MVRDIDICARTYIGFASICDESSAGTFLGGGASGELIALVALDPQGDVEQESEHKEEGEGQPGPGRRGERKRTHFQSFLFFQFASKFSRIF